MTTRIEHYRIFTDPSRNVILYLKWGDLCPWMCCKFMSMEFFNKWCHLKQGCILQCNKIESTSCEGCVHYIKSSGLNFPHNYGDLKEDHILKCLGKISQVVPYFQLNLKGLKPKFKSQLWLSFSIISKNIFIYIISWSFTTFIGTTWPFVSRSQFLVFFF